MTVTEPGPPQSLPPSLRDRLHATVTSYGADDPLAMVENICTDMTDWLRVQAQEWHDRANSDIDVMGYGRAAAVLCQGLADGIEAGRPIRVTTQDVGVES